MFGTDTRTTRQFTVPPTELSIDHTVVEWALGYGRGKAPEVIAQLIEETLPISAQRAHIECGFTILPPGTVKVVDHSLTCDGVTFATGPIIAKRLRTVDACAFLAATVGRELEQWSRELMDGPDAVKGFIVDAIASCMAEETANWLEARLEETVRPRGWKVTNRYSPGHCGWSVAEQHKLFSFLPEGFCGISLTPTALMIPMKSLTGIIGLDRRRRSTEGGSLERTYRRDATRGRTVSQ